MASTQKRERQLARERYERQQARRAAARAKRRQLHQVAASVFAVLLVVAGVVYVAQRGPDEATPASALKNENAASVTPSPAASPTPTASPSDGHDDEHGCVYTKTEGPAKDVGIPKYDEETAHEPFSATLKTNRGDIVIAVDAEKAPCTATSFKHLASKGFYAKTSCHRLTTEGLFVLQCGNAGGSSGGEIGPGYAFGVENAPADGTYPPGTVAMARTNDPNSNGSQFFLVYDETSLPTDGGGYTIFGRITEGLDVVKKVASAGVEGGGSDGAPAQKVTINSVELGQT